MCDQLRFSPPSNTVGTHCKAHRKRVGREAADRGGAAGVAARLASRLRQGLQEVLLHVRSLHMDVDECLGKEKFSFSNVYVQCNWR